MNLKRIITEWVWCTAAHVNRAPRFHQGIDLIHDSSQFAGYYIERDVWMGDSAAIRVAAFGRDYCSSRGGMIAL